MPACMKFVEAVKVEGVFSLVPVLAAPAAAAVEALQGLGWLLFSELASPLPPAFVFPWCFVAEGDQ